MVTCAALFDVLVKLPLIATAFLHKFTSALKNFLLDNYLLVFLYWNRLADIFYRLHLPYLNLIFSGGYVTFVIPRSKGGFVIGHNQTVSSLDLETGKTEVIHQVEKNKTNTRFNDAKCDPSGRLWAGKFLTKIAGILTPCS